MPCHRDMPKEATYLAHQRIKLVEVDSLSPDRMGQNSGVPIPPWKYAHILPCSFPHTALCLCPLLQKGYIRNECCTLIRRCSVRLITYSGELRQHTISCFLSTLNSIAHLHFKESRLIHVGVACEPSSPTSDRRIFPSPHRQCAAHAFMFMFSLRAHLLLLNRGP